MKIGKTDSTHYDFLGLPTGSSTPGVDGVDGKSAYEIAILNGYIGTEAQWVAGLAGIPGPTGIQGVQGEVGPKGDKGDSGIQGLQGNDGIAGYTPVKGIDYFDGNVGPQGLQGIQGTKGDIGSTGPQGPSGNSAYQVAVAQGYVGTESQWVVSLKGDTGTQGSQGVQGPTGTNGVGVPVGGTTGQVLSKVNATDYNTQWVTPASGGVTDHTLLTNIGTNTHAQVDIALARLVNTLGTNTGDQDLSGYSLTSHTHAYEPTITKTTGYAKWTGTVWSFVNETYQALSANLTSWSALATSDKQDTLVSGTNIKTINGASVLGSGDLVVTGGAGLSATTAVMTSTQANSTVTDANVTQLTLDMVANGVYQVNCFVTFQSAATTTGLKLGYTSPTGCRCMCEIVVPIASTAVASALRTTFPNAAVATNIGSVIGTGVTAINSNHTARISGIIRNGSTTGNFQVLFASEVATSAITLQIGSEMQLIRIA